MCHSGCPYENFNGACKGRPRGPITVRPHCFEDGDVEAYNESVDDDAILAYELDRCDAQDHFDNRREEYRIRNR